VLASGVGIIVSAGHDAGIVARGSYRSIHRGLVRKPGASSFGRGVLAPLSAQIRRGGLPLSAQIRRGVSPRSAQIRWGGRTYPGADPMGGLSAQIRWWVAPLSAQIRWGGLGLTSLGADPVGGRTYLGADPVGGFPSLGADPAGGLEHLSAQIMWGVSPLSARIRWRNVFFWLAGSLSSTPEPTRGEKGIATRAVQMTEVIVDNPGAKDTAVDQAALRAALGCLLCKDVFRFPVTVVRPHCSSKFTSGGLQLASRYAAGRRECQRFMEHLIRDRRDGCAPSGSRLAQMACHGCTHSRFDWARNSRKGIPKGLREPRRAARLVSTGLRGMRGITGERSPASSVPPPPP